MRKTAMIYIAVAVILVVAFIGLVIYNHSNNDDSTDLVSNNSSDSNLSNNNTSNKTLNNSSEASTDSNKTQATADYSDYETEQYIDADGMVCLRDIGYRENYTEHLFWQSRQCDKLEADGYELNASHRNYTDVDGYNAFDANGNIVVHVDA